MIVYRIHHAESIMHGPYRWLHPRDGWAPEAERESQGRRHELVFYGAGPMPSYDVRFTPTVRREDYGLNPCLLCGFVDEDQFVQWFDPTVSPVSVVGSWHLSAFDVPDEDVAIGGRQVVFRWSGRTKHLGPVIEWTESDSAQQQEEPSWA